MTMIPEDKNIVPVEVKPIRMAMSPAELGKEVKVLDEVFRSIMQKGTDYDTIPGTPKPTLLKPGAEILLRAFHLEPVTEILTRTTVDDPDKPFFDFDIKVTLNWILQDGRKIRIGDGMGNANTRETRYAYRWMWSNELPTGFNKQNAITRKVKGGYVQYRRDSSSDELYTLKNTVLKMAEKRALVDAVLKVTGADRIFTQDVEDMNLPPEEPPEEKPAEVEAPKPTEKPVKVEAPTPSPTAPPPPPPRAEEPLEPEGKEMEHVGSKKVMVRILKEIPRCMYSDGQERGPLHPEEIVTVPEKDAKNIIANGAGAEIHPREETVSWVDLKAGDGNVYGTINKTEDGAEIMYSEPIDMGNPQTKAMMENFLFNKVFAQMMEKAKKESKEWNYKQDLAGDQLMGIRITGQIDDRQVKDLASPCAWACMRAKEREKKS